MASNASSHGDGYVNDRNVIQHGTEVKGKAENADSSSEVRLVGQLFFIAVNRLIEHLERNKIVTVTNIVCH